MRRAEVDLSTVDRGLAAAGAVGVGAFVAAWSACGLLRDHYSPIDDAISRLAEVGAPYRAWMTVGFVTFGAGMILFSQAARLAVPGPSWLAAVVTGVAALGVAAAPLGRADAAHYVFAVIGYVSLAALPMLAADRFRRVGAVGWARWSVGAGVGSAIFLALSALNGDHGLTQRIGLGLTDLWVVTAATSMIWSGRLGHDVATGPK
jgi:hypothetical membrane protein